MASVLETFDEFDTDSELTELREELSQYKSWVREMTRVVESGARGDMEQRVLRCNASTELHQLSNGINRLMDVSDAYVRESGAALNFAAHGKYYRHVLLNGLQGSFKNAAITINNATGKMSDQADDLTEARQRQQMLADTFENEVIDVVACVTAAATQLQATSNVLSDSAKHVSVETAEAISTTDVNTNNLHSSIEATAELEKSLLTVEANVTQSRSVSGDAVQQAQTANGIIKALNDDSDRIGGVVKLISQIAERTNLLALNATIEAARAGEVGKGFAVVASEVKNLAKQTADATNVITSDIAAVQEATSKAAEAIRTIGSTIESINTVSSEIVTSVDEQKTANKGIAHEVQLTKASCEEVSARLGMVSTAAVETETSSKEVMGAAGELSRLACTLEECVQKFMIVVRDTG